MTREEAIDYLQDARSALPYKFGEAIDMAIEALSAPSGDVISRADAIETIMSEPMNEPKYPIWFADKLKELPSADAVQGWIPCSERLPSEKDGRVLVTERDEIRIVTYSEFSGTWYLGEMCAVGGEDPIAWMPLPEPYTEECKRDPYHKESEVK